MTDIALDEKALAAPTGWLDISDEAVSGKRILLLWEPAGGLDEHVELGWFCQSAAGWVNTYGKPFSSAPDKWAPLAPFAVSSPSQVAPANPAQVTEALKVAEQAFKEIRLLLVKCLDEPERSAFWKAVRGRDAMRAVLTAAIGAGGQAVALEKRPVAFRVKDFADGWILFHDEEKALTEADATGAIIQGLYIREA